MKKFVIHPGYVTSMQDWEEHWISAGQLMRLYMVDPNECIVDDGHLTGYSEQYLKRLLHLYPRVSMYRPVSKTERAIYPLP
jgi:hypothetical protein